MQVKIWNMKNLPTADYRELKPIQGNLKDLTEKNATKLQNSLQKHGFTVPFFVWKDKAGALWILDGHQRQRLMQKLDINDNGSYLTPYVEIPAKTKKEAAEILLKISSQYGNITYEGIQEYLDTYQLDEIELADSIQFDALPLFGADPANEEDKEVGDEQKFYFAKISFENPQNLEAALQDLEDLSKTYNGRLSIKTVSDTD